MNFVKIDSTTIDDLKRRIVKFLRLGKKDIQTSFEINPFGIDSAVPKDFIALYVPTGEKGKTAILGYINKNQLAATGGLRLYSTTEDGKTEKFYVYLTNDGFLELGGTANFAVKFNELQTEFNKLKADYNSLAGKWNTFVGTYAPGSPSTVGTPPTLAGQNAPVNTSNIANAKNDKIKTI